MVGDHTNDRRECAHTKRFMCRNRQRLRAGNLSPENNVASGLPLLRVAPSPDQVVCQFTAIHHREVSSRDREDLFNMEEESDPLRWLPVKIKSLYGIEHHKAKLIPSISLGHN